MYNSVHGKFIATPLYNILLDGIYASASIKAGAETYPMGEYFFQSLFLRMTGAQEQKMKCVCWELATNDYTYRYDLLHNKNYGECSNYYEKCNIYKDLIELIRKMQPDFTVYQLWEDITIEQETLEKERKKWEKKIEEYNKKQAHAIIKKKEKETGASLNQDEKDKIINGLKSRSLPEEDFRQHIACVKKKTIISDLIHSIINMLASSQIVLWKQADFDAFSSCWPKNLKPEWIATNDSRLLEPKLQKFYEEVVYYHRNRCAHNTNSYQIDLPSLKTIADKRFGNQNYFYRFVLLILIDEVFVRLYRKYQGLLESENII